jgi:hypothetical protein
MVNLIEKHFKSILVDTFCKKLINKGKKMKKIDLESKYSEKIQALFELKNIDFNEVFKEFNFSKEDISELTKLALDNSSEEIDYELYHNEADRLYFASSYAVIALGKLGAIEVIEPLVNKMYLNRESDAYHEAIIDYLGDIGVEAIDFIENELLSVYEDKMTLFDGLDKIVKNNLQEKERVSDLLAKYLEKTDDDKSHLGFAISLLVEFSGVKYIDIIRETFKTKEIDIMFAGDLEDIEIKLGLREKRSRPREKNKLEQMIEMFQSEGGEVSVQQVRTEPKIGRNDPCPCGSGKKYKKCCINK